VATYPLLCYLSRVHGRFVGGSRSPRATSSVFTCRGGCLRDHPLAACVRLTVIRLLPDYSFTLDDNSRAGLAEKASWKVLHSTSSFARMALIGLLLAMTACGGGDDDNTPPPAPLPPLPGSIRVFVDFTGTNFDLAVPTVSLDGGAGRTGIAAPIVFDQVPVGNHDIRLQGLHARCVRAGGAAQTAAVAAGATTDVRYSVDCRDTDQLAYSRNSVLMITDADGQRSHQLIDQPSTFFAWSGDGRQLAISYGGSIALINADGTNLRKLPWNDPAHAPGRPSWSPDGTRLTFQMSEQTSPMVFFAGVGVMDLSGNVLGTPIWFQGWVSEVSWAPDSSGFVFAASSVSFDNGSGAYVMSRDGARTSFYSQAVSGIGADWSPDGQTILVTRFPEVQEITPAGAFIRILTTCSCSTANWSPDGNTIAVHDGGDLELVDTNGVLLSTIPGDNGTPEWSPSGIYWAYRSPDGIIISRPDGSGAITVSDEGNEFYSWRP
jgi:Tol biopolymer transport system component